MLAIFQNRKPKPFNCPISGCLPSVELTVAQFQPVTTQKNQASTDSLESWTLFKVDLISCNVPSATVTYYALPIAEPIQNSWLDEFFFALVINT